MEQSKKAQVVNAYRKKSFYSGFAQALVNRERKKNRGRREGKRHNSQKEERKYNKNIKEVRNFKKLIIIIFLLMINLFQNNISQ